MIEIIGQDRALSFLERTAAAGALPNSLLFTGRSGVGKYSSALWLSALANCSADVGRPCWKCRICRNTERLNLVDLRVISPDPATLNIRIDQIRGVSEDAAFAPSECRRKTVIIRDAHRMTEEAANSILKVLEEPPEYMLFILTAPDRDSVIPTVASRCFSLSFSELPAEEIRSWLVDRMGIDYRKALVAASVSLGSLGAAIEYVSSPEAAGLRTGLMSLLSSMGSVSSFALSARLSGLFPSMQESGFIAARDVAAVWARDLMALKSGASPELVVNRDFTEELRRQASEISMERLSEIPSLIMETAGQMERNVSPALAADRLFQRIWLSFGR